MRAELALVALLALGWGCSSDTDDGTKSETDSGTGGAAGGGSICPDPNDPRVHYESADPNECQGVTLDCTTDQNGFQNQCGCGCIDKGDPMCPAPTDPEIT